MYYESDCFDCVTTAVGAVQKHVSERISSLAVLMGCVVAIIRSCFSVLVFALLLCSVFPVEQVRWAADSIVCGSIGETGHEQACDSRDTGAATESGDDSSQEMQD